MKFEKAIQQLKKGKKVRRPMWNENSYWKLGTDDEICWTNGSTAHIHLNQVEANDFEIYEKEENKFTKEILKKLNNIHFKYSGTIQKCDDMQRLKDLILDDIYLLIKVLENST